LPATQWEAWLGLYFGKRLISFQLKTPDMDDLQKKHVERLKHNRAGSVPEFSSPMSTEEMKPRRTLDKDFIDKAVKLVTQEGYKNPRDRATYLGTINHIDIPVVRSAVLLVGQVCRVTDVFGDIDSNHSYPVRSANPTGKPQHNPSPLASAGWTPSHSTLGYLTELVHETTQDPPEKARGSKIPR
jgi:hypothetical protein